MDLYLRNGNGRLVSLDYFIRINVFVWGKELMIVLLIDVNIGSLILYFNEFYFLLLLYLM